MPERQAKVIAISKSMPRLLFLALSLITALFLLFAAKAHAETAVHQDDTTQIYTLIHQHVKAIKDRDAVKAYDHISLNEQEKYGTAKLFWRDVRQNMQILFNHSSYSFLGQNTVNGTILQKVSMTDKKGKENLVIFKLYKDQSDNYRIKKILIIGAQDSLA